MFNRRDNRHFNVLRLTWYTYLILGCWSLGHVHAYGSKTRKLQGAAVPRGWELREALEKLDRDLYDNAPGPERPYISQLKNPCWATDVDGRGPYGGAVRCLPYALLLGGFQCGAASLFAALSKHPLVAKTRVSRWHFWAESDKTMSGYLEGLAEGAARVVTWPEQLAAAAAALGAGAGAGAGSNGTGAAGGVVDGAGAGSIAWLQRQEKVILDGSSSTFAFYWSPGVRAHRAFVAAMSPCWQGCQRGHREGPGREECLEGCYPGARQADRKVASSLGLPYNDVSLPLLISAVYGKRPPKMVVLLRNPVDRLYSAFWKYGHYQDKYGASPEGFAKYVREQLSTLRSCTSRGPAQVTRGADDAELSCLLHLETWGLREERLFFHADQILRGVYSIYLETWLKFFDRRGLLVLRSEDYFARPLETFMRVLRFLDLDPAAINHHRRIELLTSAMSSASSSSSSMRTGGRGSGGGDDGEGEGTAGVADVKRIQKAFAQQSTAGDEKLWSEIRNVLTADREGRYRLNRAAALRRGGGGGSGTEEAAADAVVGADTRPAMPADVRQELQSFYAPYNRRLAEILGEPDFIRGWDQ